MPIEKNSVVTFHYRLSVDGQQLEQSHDGEPMTYLHGHGNVIPGLENEMAGKDEGASFTAVVPPELAYGFRTDQGIRRVQMKHVLTKGKLQPGQFIMVNSEEGPRQVQVLKPGKFVVDVDANHPLAGATLTFDIEILAVRAANDEELAHGHAHGQHGHGHEH
ncbi:MAG: peptidylprolyl isomerase [Gammaproteobacteria bacterium]|nr:peptidylprolyl isomerase [Gammaproteobacteria bacterium]